MPEKKISKIYKREYVLDKPLYKDNSEVQSAEYTDHYIDGVTYRVWSAFEGKTDPTESLGVLMLRKLESGEYVGEVIDEFEVETKRILNDSMTM